MPWDYTGLTFWDWLLSVNILPPKRNASKLLHLLWFVHFVILTFQLFIVGELKCDWHVCALTSGWRSPSISVANLRQACRAFLAPLVLFHSQGRHQALPSSCDLHTNVMQVLWLIFCIHCLYVGVCGIPCHINTCYSKHCSWVFGCAITVMLSVFMKGFGDVEKQYCWHCHFPRILSYPFSWSS